MIWLLLSVATCLIVELFYRLPIVLTAKNLSGMAAKSARVIKSGKISDHWKEKVLLRYSCLIFEVSILLLVYLLLCFSPLIVIDFLGKSQGNDLVGFTMSFTGLSGSIAVAIIYATLRKRLAGG